jgi:hypothetical protein
MRKFLIILSLAALLLASRAGDVAAQTTPFAPYKAQTTKADSSCFNMLPFTITCEIDSPKENQYLSSSKMTEIEYLSMADKILAAAKDERVEKLQAYFAKHKSPLQPYARDFVYYADTYGLDWKLVAAISGVESTFGKHIPANSYNAYGWANGAHKFTSWPDSIEHVSRVLRTKYYDRGVDTIPEIARVYAPPSKTWGGNVQFFMTKIDEFEI